MDYTKGKWIYNGSEIENGSHVICTMNFIGDNADNDANLISASPELYEALKRFLESSACTNGCDPNDMTCDTNFARKAIAKAEGKG